MFLYSIDEEQISANAVAEWLSLSGYVRHVVLFSIDMFNNYNLLARS